MTKFSHPQCHMIDLSNALIFILRPERNSASDHVCKLIMLIGGIYDCASCKYDARNET